MMLCSIGPRQMTGLSPGFSKPIEIIFTPCACTGMMCWSAVAPGSCVEPSMIGTFGPYTSASSRPTLWPSFASASARLTATVVLPTPPLPLAMAIRFFTPGIGWRCGICWGAGPGGIKFRPILNRREISARRYLVMKSHQLEIANSRVGAVALFVFFAGAAGARIVAANFGASAHGLRCFRLCRAGLILQFFFLALLFAFHCARERRQLRGSFGGTRSRTGCCRQWAWRRWWRSWRLVAAFHLHLHVEEITHGFVVDARHHVFEKNECFFLELNERIFLRIAAKADRFLQVIERQQVIFPLRIDHVKNDAALEPADKVRRKLLLFVFVLFPNRFD